MRDALDKHYADAGNYPAPLEELVAKRYLRSIPKDPFTQSASTWIAGAAGRPEEGRRLRRARAAPKAMSAGSRRPKGFTYLGHPDRGGRHRARGLAASRRASPRTPRSARRNASCCSSATSTARRSPSYYKQEQRYPRRWRPARGQALSDAGAPPAPALPRPDHRQADWGWWRRPRAGSWACTAVRRAADQDRELPVRRHGASTRRRRYADWKFVHSPPGLPAAVEKSGPSNTIGIV